jgi:hypothetical protein
MRLLQNSDQLPHHMKVQFFQGNTSAVSLVGRLKRLADVNPDFRKAAKPLLDNLQNFFSLPAEGQQESQVAEGGLLPPQEQAQAQLARQPKPGQAEQQVLSDLGARPQLAGSEQQSSQRRPPKSQEAPTPPPEESQGEELPA